MRSLDVLTLALALTWSILAGCSRSSSSPTIAQNVKLVFRGSTSRRLDLPASVANCVGETHTHPSWRSFAAIPLTPVPPDRYEIVFDDVPIDAHMSFRVNDQNFCDQNPTGAVTRNVFLNDVELRQNALTPGNGDEPGHSFSLTASGRITQ